MFSLFGVKGRVGTLFRIYVAAKQRFSEMPEREVLEIVVGELIPQGRTTQLRNLGIEGKKYLDDVFENKEIDIDGLIFHIICLEFPKKYPSRIDLQEIEKQATEGILSEKDKLKEEIRNQHQKFVSG